MSSFTQKLRDGWGHLPLPKWLGGSGRSLIFGDHPDGLKGLFKLEICERMSYYGIVSLLVLFLKAKIDEGGLGYSESWAKTVFAIYTGVIYLTPLLGGFLADRWFGARRVMLAGAIVIAIGHFCVAFQSITAFYAGLALIAIGTGLLKPNVNTMVSHLYAPDDPKRGAGFNLLYMGINIGAAMAPIICGALAEGDDFKALLSAAGLDPLHSWHWGFAAAGVAMLFGLVMYWWHREDLAPYGDPPQKKQVEKAQPVVPLTRQEWHKLAALAFLFVAFTLYCAVSQQSGTTLTIFAKEMTQLSIGDWHFSASQTLALNPIFIILLTFVFNRIWRWLNDRKMEPTESLKFSIGMVFLACGSLLMVPASWSVVPGLSLASPFWLVGVYFFQTVAELCMSPVGNAAATRLAPSRFASLTMGVWYTSVGIGSFIGGFLSGLCNGTDPNSFAVLFTWVGAGTLALSVAIYFATPKVNTLMASAPNEKPSGGHG